MIYYLYIVKVCGVEVYSTTDELAAYAYKNLCEGSYITVLHKKRRK